MPTALLDLDDPPASDSARAGAKAAGLARARRAGLPALPGVVVPAEQGAAAREAAGAALRSGGSGGARLAVMAADVDPSLLEDLRASAEAMGLPAVVRSSSALEQAGLWSGVLSSYHDVGPDDLRTAVRGCWASPFAVHALEQAEMAGVDPTTTPLAVLVQPQVEPHCGGSARRRADGGVELHVAKGSPRDLLAGRRSGFTAAVEADGRLSGDEACDVIGAAPLRAAADLARAAAGRLKHDLVEWGWIGGRVVLFQSSRSPARLVNPLPPPTAAFAHPLTLRLASLAARFPGSLGERLVLPWALAAGRVEQTAARPSRDVAADFAQACELADGLTKQAWESRASGAVAEAHRLFAALRAGRTAGVMERLSRLRPVDPARGGDVVGLLHAVADGLVGCGRLPSAERFWRLTLEQAARQVRGDEADRRAGASTGDPVRLGPDRWEPFVHAAIRARGRRVAGVGATPGIAAGRPVYVANPHRGGVWRERDVLVAPGPLPGLAPLLWRASAVVTLSGNPGAHLFEVAAALGIPSVVNLDPRGADALRTPSPEHVLAVDGTTGLVALAEVQP